MHMIFTSSHNGSEYAFVHAQPANYRVWRCEVEARVCRPLTLYVLVSRGTWRCDAVMDPMLWNRSFEEGPWKISRDLERLRLGGDGIHRGVLVLPSREVLAHFWSYLILHSWGRSCCVSCLGLTQVRKAEGVVVASIPFLVIIMILWDDKG